MQSKSNVVLPVTVDTSEVEQATKKMQQLIALLKEANSLADELASKDLKISIRI